MICEHAMRGEREKARKIDASLAGLHEKLFVESNPIPVKWAVYRMGLIEAGIRLPLTWMSEKYIPELESAMREAGVL